MAEVVLFFVFTNHNSRNQKMYHPKLNPIQNFSHRGKLTAMRSELTLELLQTEAKQFATAQSLVHETSLYGVTDGKAVGTHIEAKFVNHLFERYTFTRGNAAKGIDLPSINLDIKVTNVTQPQSSCPFRSARQKIFGLGYSLLVFVYEKTDDQKRKTSNLSILHTVLVAEGRTADFTTTRLLRETIKAGGNKEDLVALMFDRNLPLDEIEANTIALELLEKPPLQGYIRMPRDAPWWNVYAGN